MIKVLLLNLLLLVSSRNPDGPVVCEDEKAFLRGEAPPHGFEQWCELPQGVKHGQYKAWHTNGKVAKDYWYQNGQLDGPVTEFLPNRFPTLTGFYKNGKKSGTFQVVNPKDTSDSTDIPYVAGVAQGAGRRSIAEGGTAPATFQNGRLVGTLNFSDLRGWVYKKCQVQNGEMGTCTYFFPPGKPTESTSSEEFDGEFAEQALSLCYSKQPPYLTGTATKALVSPLVKIRITALNKRTTSAQVEVVVAVRDPSPFTIAWKTEKRRTFSFSRSRSGVWKPMTCPWF